MTAGYLNKNICTASAGGSELELSAGGSELLPSSTGGSVSVTGVATSVECFMKLLL